MKVFAAAASRVVFATVSLSSIATVLYAQGSSVMITPDQVTILVGERRAFRLVDMSGVVQHGVSWTVSDAGSFQIEEGDELTITPMRAGEFRVTARVGYGLAEATVKVMGGNALPVGTAKWSNSEPAGCTSVQIVPAVPDATGLDLYQSSACSDGQYLSGFTADGFLLWRQKIDAAGAPAGTIIPGFPTSHAHPSPGALPSPNAGRGAAPALTPAAKRRWTSVCDSVSIGTDQQKIRDLLRDRGLSFSEGGSGGPVWTVDESSTQCKLEFDDKLTLAHKSKVFVVQ
jgi:hypothetical protein